MLEVKIRFGVVVTDILYHLSKPFLVIWQFTILHIGSKQVTQYPSEVLMAGIRKETSGICKHPHKAAQQSHIRQSIELFDHAILLVQEPPARSPLYFTSNCTIIVITNHGGHQLIISRVQVIQYGFCQTVLAVQVV